MNTLAVWRRGSGYLKKAQQILNKTIVITQLGLLVKSV